MKCATIAASLVPLAAAASLDTRQDKDTTLEITGFEASCTGGTDTCWYRFGTIERDGFGVGCDVSGTSKNGTLPEVKGTRCGIYQTWIYWDNEDLTVTLIDVGRRRGGGFRITPDELETETSNGKEVQSYTGDGDYTVNTRYIGGAGDPITPSGSPSGTPSSTSTPTGTQEPKPSETNSETDADSQDTDNDADNDNGDGDSGAPGRGSAIGVIAGAVGVMALVL